MRAARGLAAASCARSAVGVQSGSQSQCALIRFVARGGGGASDGALATASHAVTMAHSFFTGKVTCRHMGTSYGLLGCDVVQPGTCAPTFGRYKQPLDGRCSDKIPKC